MLVGKKEGPVSGDLQDNTLETCVHLNNMLWNHECDGLISSHFV